MQQDHAAGAGADPGTPNRSHRPIRSFVLREGRLTSAQERAFTELWPRFGVDWEPGTRLQTRGIFCDAPPEACETPALPAVYLEIGFGNGETLATMAEVHPERRYFGVEVHRPGIGHLLLELQRRRLDNVRVLRQDAVELLAQGLPAASLDGVYLFFPDPWPKQRHHKRRILSPAFVALLARVLRPAAPSTRPPTGPPTPSRCSRYSPKPSTASSTRPPTVAIASARRNVQRPSSSAAASAWATRFTTSSSGAGN